MSISRVSNGLILKDDFNNSFNPMWDIFPNDTSRVLFKEDSIVLLPENNSPTEMLIPCPGGKFIMQTEIEYNPVVESDAAGVVIKSVTDCNVEARFSYEEGVINEYKFVKFTHDDGYVVNLRASKDGITWEDFGNSKLYDGNYVGYFVDGEQAGFEIKNCFICRDKYLVIQGIKEGDVVNLLNSNNEDIIETLNLDYIIKGDKFMLDISNQVWPIKDIRLVINFGKSNGSIHHIGDLYGGDVFSFEPELLFSVDETNETPKGFDLGEVYGLARNYTLRVYNNGTEHKTGKLVIDAISTYEQGHHMAYIYPYDSDFDTKSKELEVSIGPGQEFVCIVRIVKESKYVTIDGEFSFNVVFMK